MATDRLPPQNIEAEQSVLGSLLIDPDAIVRVSSVLKPEDFYRETHQLIYRAIMDLHERRSPADLVTVTDELERLGALGTIGGASYLTSLVNTVPTSVNVEYYAHIVERTRVMRRLIEASAEIAALAYEDREDIAEVVDMAESIIFDISQRRGARDLTPIADIISEYYDQVEDLSLHPDRSSGVPTGFADLDALLGNMQRSDLLIVAARPGVGKSSFATTIASNAARQHAVVAMFTLEMSSEQLVQRMISASSGIDSKDLRTGRVLDRWDDFTRVSTQLAGTQIFIDDSSSLTPMEIRSKARRLAAEYSLDLIIIDYLQLMQAGDRRSENRVQEISYITRSLKSLARELDVPVIALSQLSRAVENRPDKRPQLSDLRESGSIEQDADIVMFIYREDILGEPTDRNNIADIIVAKHRNGALGTISLYFNPKLTWFADLHTPSEEVGGYIN
ncbi:MAG: replicative DNA helicase [Chloroflexi bacterium]|nr:replicative DNA helicase [Chloroflexota bacterium]